MDWFPNNNWLWHDVTDGFEEISSTLQARCEIQKENWLWHQEPYVSFLQKHDASVRQGIKKEFKQRVMKKHVDLPDRQLSKLNYLPL